MSRLIVKNLPQEIKPERLKQLFSEKGLVTDVQLKYTKDGKFRRFGFIGFKTEDEAHAAKDYFDNTYINASQIKIELCAKLGDPDKPRSWSKYAADSYVNVKKEEENANVFSEEVPKKKKDIRKQILEKSQEDPLFAEYVQVHRKSTKLIWANDTNVESGQAEREKSGSGEEDSGNETKESIEYDDDDDGGGSETSDDGDNLAKKDISDAEYFKQKMVKSEGSNAEESDVNVGKRKIKKKVKTPIELFTVTVRGLAYKAKKKDVKGFFHPLKPKSIRIPVTFKGTAYVGFKTEKERKKALNKDKSFLSGKRIFVKMYENKTTPPIIEENRKWKDQEENSKNDEIVAETGRIFVRNLDYTVTEEEIESLFNKYGPVTEVNLPVDRLSRKTKGFAIVTFMLPEHAVKAYTELDGSILHGRMLHLLPGKEKESKEDLLEKEGLTFKQKKQLKMKLEGGSAHNWNTLFLGQNAVADIMADKYGMPKEKILDARGHASIAVRLALGETQIVNETRDFLIESGIQLDAFNRPAAKRSKTVILVKNLPARTTSKEIGELFHKFGELGRVVLPPSGVTAIVEFLEPSEARTAFRNLVYTKFHDLPLYLEWAPADTFSTPPPAATKMIVENKTNETSKEKDKDEDVQTRDYNNVDEGKEENDPSDDDEEEPEPDTTLFVKNMSFSTNEDSLKKHFSHCGPIHCISISRKKDTRNPGKMVSMGFGFVQFKHKESADKALKTLQQSILDEFCVELKRSDKRLSNENVQTARKKTKIGKQTGTKILVRNIPFQATVNEVAELFKAFGELRAVRLPKKMSATGEHRGFAFVDFYTKHDAKRAFKALCKSTHLIGRRLVLEWANPEETVEDLRKKTARYFDEVPAEQRQKKGKITDIMEMEDS